MPYRSRRPSRRGTREESTQPALPRLHSSPFRYSSVFVRYFYSRFYHPRLIYSSFRTLYSSFPRKRESNMDTCLRWYDEEKQAKYPLAM